MIIDCVSDLHGEYPELEGGDLLIIAGDLTARSNLKSILLFNEWMFKQNYKKKIFIAGNHDNFIFDTYMSHNSLYGCTYLCDTGIEFEGLKIWGSPWTKTFEGMNPRCKAFTVDTEEELEDKWKLIPNDIHILITHCPPYGILDEISSYPDANKKNVGSKSLRNFTTSGDRFPTKRLHVFGHIHEQGGKMIDLTMSRFVNASIVDENYVAVHKPVRIIL